MKRLSMFGLFLFIFSLATIAQTPQVIEQTLVKNLKEVQKFSSYGGNYDDEKLSKANEVFENNLLNYTKIASTLSYGFPALNKMMMNATSEDGKFRIYSWDTETGGTMHDYSRIYQFRGGDGKVYSHGEPRADEEGGAGSFVYAIYSVDSNNGKIYIVCSNFIGSTNDHYQSADLYKIEGNELKDKIKLIKTASGMTDTLNFEYNFFSVVDRKERPIKLIQFDKKTNTLKIPVVINDKEFPNGRVTNKFISYKFNGTNFVKVS
ncbi:MAG: hypothetical protein K1X72_19880 [Pyrinomonadaceae bacterium]|nr:hypothetical protein [Pyrinomonadaceae bacterium]